MSMEDTSAYGCFTRACMKWSEQRGSLRSSSDAWTSRRQSYTWHLRAAQDQTRSSSARATGTWKRITSVFVLQPCKHSTRRLSQSCKLSSITGMSFDHEFVCKMLPGLRSLGAASWLTVAVLCQLTPPARPHSALGMLGRPSSPPSHSMCLRVRGGDDSSLFEVGSELDEPRKRRRDQPAAGASPISTLRVYVCRAGARQN